MCHYTATGSSCVPLVVRPQEIPQPAVPLPVNLGLVPGPCTVKKAIVRPAIVPKPTCQAQEKPPIYGFGGSGAAKYSEGKYSGVEGFVDGNGGGSITSGIGGEVFLGSRVGGFSDGGCKPLGAVIQGVGLGDYRIGTPADPLNGKVIEFVPPKPGCKTRTLEEEAVEDLLQLEAEEAAVEEAEESRKGPFLDVAADAVNQAVNAVAGAASAAASSSSGSAAVGEVVDSVTGAIAGAAGAALNGGFGNNGYLPGNVEYRTLPKIPDSCESGEINLPKIGSDIIKFNQQAFSHKTQSNSNVFLQKLQFLHLLL
nr:unnamed protein product [Callosobruchus analis]